MAAEETSTWDIDIAVGGARRPTLADLGGADFLDDDDYPPPRDGSEPYATEYNQSKKQAFAAGQMIPSVRLTIDFSGGNPFIDKLMAPGTAIVAGDFTLDGTTTGRLVISWTAGKLPEMVCDPQVSLNVDTANDCSISVAKLTATSVRVNTRVNGVLADARFTIDLH